MDGRSPVREGAFTLVEALVASALFLGVSLTVAPLLTGAALLNVAGRGSTEIANLARSRAEELARLPFDSERLATTAGERRLEEYWDEATSDWMEGEPPESARWLRTTTVRAFPLEGLAQPPGRETTPARGTAAPLKEIRVAVRPGGRGALGARVPGVTLRLLRSF